jgi:putative endonuclease
LEATLSNLQDFRRQAHTRARGRSAETSAVDWLERNGFSIRKRNHSTPAGEIDVVATEGETLCFIEIKARSGSTFGPAIAAVTPRKQRRLARAAALYLAFEPFSGPCRFDVLGLDSGSGGWEFTLVRNAFEVP